MDKPRKIIHIDMDAFYASVEQRDNENLMDKPVVVGGSPDKRGVVAACSYEARKYGIHSAMSSSRALRLCPDVIFVKPRFSAYQEVSSVIHKIFKSYTNKVEPLSLDEAFLDVSNATIQNGSATLIAEEIRSDIKSKTNLTASAGVSYNKFLAKIASDVNKPNGLYVIAPEQADLFIKKLPIGKFYGVGKVTESKMQAMGIYTGADLRQLSKERLAQAFGKVGSHYYDIVRGIDNREVVSNRKRKSIGAETTFEYDLIDKSQMLDELYKLAKRVVVILEKKRMVTRTVTLKLKYDNFRQVTRSITFDAGIASYADIIRELPILLEKTDINNHKVRLLGVSVSNLSDCAIKCDSSHQINLF